ncbi:MAG TPA: family 16 glycoside hydrolase [Gemmataceae bacterium]|nr:family 16 glycoside hydrolase [Gemmataceae bacterium]
MPKINTCPKPDQYQQLMSGSLPDGDKESLLAHLEGCDACAQQIHSLPEPDTLVGLLRQSDTLSEEASRKAIAGLVDRLSKLRPQAGAAATNVPRSGGTVDATIDRPADATPHAKYDFLAPPRAPDEIGRLGPYRVLEVLGSGGMGVVFRAEDPQLARLVALKAMLPGFLASENARQRFLREARAAAKIKHDNIVSIYQVGEDRGVQFLAMEFLEGEPLDKRLDRQGKLPTADVLRIGKQIALALAAAHKRDMIHRDIKPANIWLEADTDRVKILDFGLARGTRESGQLTQQGAIVGTPAYMAPEQGKGKEVDHRCDLFSLGCVLYRMTTGQAPFRGTDVVSTLVAVATETPKAPRAIEPSVPRALSDLIVQLLAKDPAQRPESAQAVAEKLDAIGQEQRPAPAKLRRWWPVVAGAAACLAILVAGIVYYMQTPDGVVRIEINDPKIELKIKGHEAIITDADKQPITLKPGPHGLTITRGEFAFNTDTFKMPGKGGKTSLEIKWIPGQKILVLQDGKTIADKEVPKSAPEIVKPAPVAHDRRIQFRTGGDWRIEGKELVGTPNINGSGGRIFFGDETWTDYDFEVECQSINTKKNGHGICLAFRVKDTGNYLDIDIGGWGATVTEAIYFKNGKWGRSPGCFLKIPHEHGRWYKVKIEARGKNIRCTVDGKEILAYRDDTLLSGMIGVGTGNSPCRWRNLKVTAPDGKILWEGFPDLPSAEKSQPEEWVKLFNGKDLTGWKLHPKQPDPVWKVDGDGNLVGAGSISHLFSERGDYADFHLRAVCKISKGGDSGIFFRSEFGVSQPRWNTWFEPKGYEAGINHGHFAFATGTLFGPDPKKVDLQSAKADRIKPDQWFTMEIIARGNHIQVRVADQTVTDYVDAARFYSSGHIALQVGPDKPTVHFKSIEVRRLSGYNNSLGMEFARVPAGKAWLGGGAGKPGDKEVEFKDDFYLGVHEVTQDEWEKVVGINPSHYARTGAGAEKVKDVSNADLKRFPVENISWDEVQTFLKKLNERDKTPGWTYRLPTTSEWEYACRGGPMTDRLQSGFDAYFDKPTNNLLASQANFKNKDAPLRPMKVGSFPPNPLGLHDMIGNVWEWAADEVVDPGRPPGHRLVGGFFGDTQEFCRAGGFGWGGAGHRAHAIGFRVARVRVD